MQCISLYMDYKLDESYTPSKIAVRAGTNFHDLTVSNTFLVWLPGPLTALKCKAKKSKSKGPPLSQDTRVSSTHTQYCVMP